MHLKPYIIVILTASTLASCTSVPIALKSQPASKPCTQDVIDVRDELVRHKVQASNSGDLMLGTGQLVLSAAPTPAAALESILCERSETSHTATVRILKLTASYYNALNHLRCDAELLISVEDEDGSIRDLTQPVNVRDESTNRNLQSICGEAIDKAFEQVAARIASAPRRASE